MLKWVYLFSNFSTNSCAQLRFFAFLYATEWLSKYSGPDRKTYSPYVYKHARLHWSRGASLAIWTFLRWQSPARLARLVDKQFRRWVYKLATVKSPKYMFITYTTAQRAEAIMMSHQAPPDGRRCLSRWITFLPSWPALVWESFWPPGPACLMYLCLWCLLIGGDNGYQTQRTVEERNVSDAGTDTYRRRCSPSLDYTAPSQAPKGYDVVQRGVWLKLIRLKSRPPVRVFVWANGQWVVLFWQWLAADGRPVPILHYHYWRYFDLLPRYVGFVLQELKVSRHGNYTMADVVTILQ